MPSSLSDLVDVEAEFTWYFFWLSTTDVMGNTTGEQVTVNSAEAQAPLHIVPSTRDVCFSR